MARILIIDDELIILKSTGFLLQSDGHEVVPIDDSRKATEAIRTEKFDVIITDIRMTPVSGMELIRLARTTQPQTPLIVVSAYGAEKTEKECMELGCVAYIRKPFKMDDVLGAVRKALELRKD